MSSTTEVGEGGAICAIQSSTLPLQPDLTAVDSDVPPQQKQNNDNIVDSDVAQQQPRQHGDLDVYSGVATKQQHGEIAVDSDVPPVDDQLPRDEVSTDLI